MRLCVVFAALLMGDFALARGVQAIRAKVASRVAQLLQVQKVQQIVAISYLQQEKEAGLAGLYSLSASDAKDKDTPDSNPSETSDGGSPDADGFITYYHEGVLIVEPYPPLGPSWKRPGPPDGIPPLDKPQRMPDGYLPSSDSSSGGSPDSVDADPISGYSRGGGSGGGPDSVDADPISGYSRGGSGGGPDSIPDPLTGY